MQGLPLVSLLAGANLLMEPPVVKPQISILVLVCDPNIWGKGEIKDIFPQKNGHDNSNKQRQVVTMCMSDIVQSS